MPRICSSLLIAAILAGTTRIALGQAVDTLSVSVHGHQMRLVASGGPGPVIVLEAGAGSSHRTWAKLRPLLPPSLRVVAYDRPGFGASELCPGPRDARTIAQELHAALAAAVIPPPYLVVGWSAGGLYGRTFSGLYPSEVIGLLLLDPPQEDFYPRAQHEFPAVYQRLNAVDSSTAAAGSPAERAEEQAWDVSLLQAKASDGIARTPIVVLGAVRPDLEQLGPLWTDEQRLWASRQSAGTFRVVSGTGHAIHRDRPDSAATVITTLARPAH